ncbi:MAG TPA: TetR/AcrR family transcriptional regulator [Candidatus Hydrogenedentes bacterium]|nr:TetR/AcrR family transcriptional regulator [Candidatus Hydrogenedentota bacterium]HPJ99250.1 TetR/AcrR family transcriptional regulator [Candidatus Hydrogenedentota bacterium]
MEKGQANRATDPANGAEARLLEGALSIFSKKGYEGASVREIIEEAGVTRPVLYYYFKNKEDLFRRLVRNCLAEMIADADAALDQGETCQSCLEMLICKAFERAERNLDEVRLLVHVIFTPPGQAPGILDEPLLDEWFTRLVKVMDDGLLRGELSGGEPEALALAFNALMDFHMMVKSRYPSVTLTPDLGKGLVALFLRGAGPGGVERLPLLNTFQVQPREGGAWS